MNILSWVHICIMAAYHHSVYSLHYILYCRLFFSYPNHRQSQRNNCANKAHCCYVPKTRLNEKEINMCFSVTEVLPSTSAVFEVHS